MPSMSQTWYIGPIAKAGTGDIGVITGFVVAVGLYTVLRKFELWILRLVDERRQTKGLTEISGVHEIRPYETGSDGKHGDF